jgi:hypothetical protein
LLPVTNIEKLVNPITTISRKQAIAGLRFQPFQEPNKIQFIQIRLIISSKAKLRKICPSLYEKRFGSTEGWGQMVLGGGLSY